MDDWMFILTVIGTVATIISTIIAVCAKNEAKKILYEVKTEKNRNASITGNTEIKNDGINTGVLLGTNTGEVNVNANRK